MTLFLGGHSIGASEDSGWVGAFTSFGDSFPTPANKYFVDLLTQQWTPVGLSLLEEFFFIFF